MVQIFDNLEIPEAELVFTTSRSSGPGGQNINKLNTRVTLLFDVDRSSSLNEAERACLRERLVGRINKQGIMRVTSQRHRTQLANREETIRRFIALLQNALYEEEVRIPVAIPKSLNERRLKQKKHRSSIKRERSNFFEDDDY